MFSRPFAVGLLAMSCVTAAAGGAYVAVRHNEPAAPHGSATAPEMPMLADSVAVQETEAVVTPAPAVEAAAPRPELVEEPRPASPNARRAKPASAAKRGMQETVAPTRVQKTAATSVSASQRTASPAARAPEPSAPVAMPTASPEPTRQDPATGGASLPEAGDPFGAEPPPLRAPAPEAIVIPAAAVMGLRLETPVTSERASIEDRVEARVARDVAADGRTAIPAGTRVIGAVTVVERGGTIKERARLGVRFHTLVLADGTELPVRTEAILREGDSPSGESSRKIGGAAVGGAILGAILGGKKGAIVGGATGAAGGTAVVMTGERNAATLPAGTVVTVRLAAPLSLMRGPVPQ